MADSTTRPSDVQLFAKKASFIQHSLPGLEAGVYQIEVKQELNKSDGSSISEGPLPTISKRFGVVGPKYAIPTDAVQSEYPPRAAAGGFSNSLAHVVLNKVKLPWIRSPYLPGNEPAIEERQYTTSYGGKEHNIAYDDDKATWLAVLTISPSDINGANPTSLITQNGSALELIPDKWKAKGANGTTPQGQLPKNGYSIFSYTLEPGQSVPQADTVDPGVGYNAETTCNFIDIPASVFNRICPSIDDLKMMAHVRAVETDAKPIADGATSEMQQSFSLVVGNRLPETMEATQIPPAPQEQPAGGNNMAVLVSLEHLENALRGHPSDGYYAKNVAASGFVRLPVLHQWQFVSWPDTSYNFVHMLKALNGRDPDGPNSGEKVPTPQFRSPHQPDYQAPLTDQQAIVSDMLQLGYSPMNQLTRVPDVNGEATQPIQTVSWYRGPFAPFPVANKQQFLSGSAATPSAQQPLIYSADQLLRFDPNVGLYDTSYAAAWQIGQLISLQDKSFSTELYRWKKSTNQTYRMMLEDAVLQDSLPGMMSSFRTAVASNNASPTRNKALYKGVMNFIATPKAD